MAQDRVPRAGVPFCGAHAAAAKHPALGPPSAFAQESAMLHAGRTAGYRKTQVLNPDLKDPMAGLPPA